MGGRPCLLEESIPFDREVSVVLARNAAGVSVPYDVGWNRHVNHILSETLVPSGLNADLESRARSIAQRIADELDYVGVLAVEFFVVGARKNNPTALLVNEIAPRVHNSGHWTMDACVASQFEQHIRAVCGWPLAPAERHSDVIMTNLIGSDVDRWHAVAMKPNTALHLYGKSESRPGRKMGHLNRLFPLGTRPESVN
jgi:5-(carboxyamino)imidazole ribonucleotide synthase